MRESTRRLYAQRATDFFRRPETRSELEDGRIFASLEVQNYLFAELGRPCLQRRHASRAHFCCIRHLNKNAPKKLGHRLETSLASPQTPFPTAVYDENYFLYSTGRFLAPFKQQTQFSHYRRNVFVVRNLNPTAARVTLACPGHYFYHLAEAKQNERENELVLSLEPSKSAVVLLSPGASRLLDEPVTVVADQSYVLVFYLADAVEQEIGSRQ